jgi:hypothetical protein
MPFKKGSDVKVALWCEDPGVAPYLWKIREHFIKTQIPFEFFATGVAAELAHKEGFIFRAGCPEASEPWGLVIAGTCEKKDNFQKCLKVAKNSNAVSVGIVDAPINVKERFQDASGSFRLPQYGIVPNDNSLELMVEIGMKRENVWRASHPQFMNLFEQEFQITQNSVAADSKDTSVKRILFLGETRGGLNPEQFFNDGSYTLRGSGVYQHRMDIVLEEFFEAMKPYREGCTIILRPHPKNQTEDYRDFLNKFDGISEGLSLQEDFLRSHLVVGMTSTALMEAAILDRETLSILPRPLEMQWLPCIEAGVSFCATERADLDASIKDWWDGKRKADRSRLKKHVFQFTKDPWIENLEKLARL